MPSKTKSCGRARILFEVLGHLDSERLIRVKKQQALGRAARKLSGKLGNTAITKALYEGEECSEHWRVKTILLCVNKAKIRASDDTPFLQEPLLSAFGTRNNTPAMDAVLQGSNHPPAVTCSYAWDLLHQLSSPPIPVDVHPFSPRKIITPLDNTKVWRKAKE